MYKKFYLAIVILVLTTSLFLAACASETPAPTQVPEPTQTTAPTLTPEPLVLVDGLGREFFLEEPVTRKAVY